MSAVVQPLVVVKVVDNVVCMIVQLYIELAAKVPPEIRHAGREDDEDVAALLHVRVELLRTDVCWKSYTEACQLSTLLSPEPAYPWTSVQRE